MTILVEDCRGLVGWVANSGVFHSIQNGYRGFRHGMNSAMSPDQAPAAHGAMALKRRASMSRDFAFRAVLIYENSPDGRHREESNEGEVSNPSESRQGTPPALPRSS